MIDIFMYALIFTLIVILGYKVNSLEQEIEFLHKKDSDLLNVILENSKKIIDKFIEEIKSLEKL